ncbi:MAG TPA: glucose-6-phosphate dehydrogenase [Bacteroides sp.]|nr:glucose-6-phosphate dehydrogenase [Bacteroides sp.]
MQKPEAHILTIFGASGDLTRRKLIPALYNLYLQDLLPDHFAVMGAGRKPFTDQIFREQMSAALKSHTSRPPGNSTEKAESFIKMLYYTSLDTSDPDSYKSLKLRLGKLGKENQTKGNMIFYLAIPPSLYTPVAHSLAAQKLTNDTDGWKRIIVEKPFGYDLESSRDLNISLREVFNEEQIYRIDHYLGKETVQNIMVTRFSNGIFEPIWNRNYVSHVEITAAESLGVGDRGGYYEGSGALRDMFQNHILQIVALVSMEPPVWADSSSIRNEMVKVLDSIRQLTVEDVKRDVVRGQYTDSVVRGENIIGYREEKGVETDSRTETYAGLKFFIDNWRWKDVPFYARTGKRLPTRVTEIVIHFEGTPHHIFRHNQGTSAHNQLIIRIQPDEGLLLKFGMKTPGAGYNVQDVNMDFHYSSLSEVYLPAAYERLLLDCMLGDSTLYARGDAVESAWRFVDPILKFWEENPSHALYGYPAGTWGPKEADDLFKDDLTWRYPCRNLADDGLYCEL